MGPAHTAAVPRSTRGRLEAAVVKGRGVEDFVRLKTKKLPWIWLGPLGDPGDHTWRCGRIRRRRIALNLDSSIPTLTPVMEVVAPLAVDRRLRWSLCHPQEASRCEGYSTAQYSGCENDECRLATQGTVIKEGKILMDFRNTLPKVGPCKSRRGSGGRHFQGLVHCARPSRRPRCYRARRVRGPPDV